MEKCKHSSLLWGVLWDIDGYYATCLACGFYVTGKTTEEVNEQLQPKEKTMSTDYDAGYKAGVEQATLPLYTTGEDFSHTYHPREINDKLDERRKKLLTKKVTKYAIVCSRTRGEGQARAYFVYDDLFEGKIPADAEAEQLRKAGAPAGRDFRVHGVFPIEIEIPL